ncbi:MAG TPA: hypothetical protein PLN86_16375 [Candidatus Hydrogenedentes bacterium]|nr:hypothetical protein [Candidatus Hydrogenedentota bacterium]
MLFKKKANDTSEWLKDNAPALTFWVASIALVFFEARVLDVMYTLTKSWLLTVGSIFATGFMFFIWKTAFQYTLANSHQVTMSTIGMTISLLASAIFGGMDFFVKGGLLIDTGADKFNAVDLLFWGVPTLSVVHVVLLLLYWYLDPVISADRKKKVADDDAKFAQDEMLHAGNLLETRRKLVDNFVSMAQKYGKEAALEQLDVLGIDRDSFKDIKVESVDDGHGGDASHGNSGNLPSMTAPRPAMTVPHPSMTEPISPIHPSMTPVPIALRTNGNGKEPNPTKAE